ncbi:lipoyl synthase [Candidatus Omnitrophota bacterium]
MLKIDLKPHLKRFPYWLKQSLKVNSNAKETRLLLHDLQINTVCQSARCPNIHDCFSRKRCTFLILGSYCTRSCRFCAVKTEKYLEPPDKRELFKIRDAVKRLGMSSAVITSVTRDDLDDGGAGHFVDCVEILKEAKVGLNIEVLVPDFLGKRSSIERIVSAMPHIFSHNVETVPRLYSKVRPQADYQRSLDVLRYVKELDERIFTKSGLMVGLGETRREIYRAMEDLKKAGCDIITIGQYLKPDPCCLEVEEFFHPEEFARFSERARGLGFKRSFCSPFARSSYQRML